MSLYGDLYTNLTTFFHKFRFKGSADNNKSFPENPLEDNIDVIPEVAYSTLSLGSGNRWIKMQQDENGHEINIYHAAPQGKNIEDISTTENIISFLSEGDENAVSLNGGGYLKLYSNSFDEAGHLKSSEEKQFSFPNYSSLEGKVNGYEGAIFTNAANIQTNANEITKLNTRIGEAKDGEEVTIMAALDIARSQSETAIGEVIKFNDTYTEIIKPAVDLVNHEDQGINKLNESITELNDNITKNNIYGRITKLEDYILNGVSIEETKYPSLWGTSGPGNTSTTGQIFTEMFAILKAMIMTLSELEGSQELYVSALNRISDAMKSASWIIYEDLPNHDDQEELLPEQL